MIPERDVYNNLVLLASLMHSNENRSCPFYQVKNHELHVSMKLVNVVRFKMEYFILF